jgi:hypothetical protein
MPQKQTAKMTRSHAETLGKNFDATILEATLADQTQGSRNRIGSA